MHEDQPEGQLSEEMDPTLAEEFHDTLSSRARILSSFLVDAILLGIGIVVLWLVQYVGEHLELHGVARWYWVAIEIILSVSSILGVTLYVVRDLLRLYRRLFRRARSTT